MNMQDGKASYLVLYCFAFHMKHFIILVINVMMLLTL
jgi:hypothetical protein